MTTPTSHTLTVTPTEAAYLRTLLERAAREGQAFEDSVLADGPDEWGGEYPADQIDDAHARSATARALLTQLT